MANLPSAKKHMKQDEKRRVRNRERKAIVKSQTRTLLEAVHDGNLDEARDLFRKVTKTLDRVAAKGTMHRNTVARTKSRLARRINAAATSPSA